MGRRTVGLAGLGSRNIAVAKRVERNEHVGQLIFYVLMLYP